jgi:hypothetical protein
MDLASLAGHAGVLGGRAITPGGTLQSDAHTTEAVELLASYA